MDINRSQELHLRLGGHGYSPLGSASVMEKPSDFIVITLEMGQLLDSTTGITLKRAKSFTGILPINFYSGSGNAFPGARKVNQLAQAANRSTNGKPLPNAL